MRFLISESCYIRGAYHQCQPGAKAILELPDTVPGPEGRPVPNPHISLRWQPLDATAQEAQVRVHQPQVNAMSGETERVQWGSRELDDEWTGKPIVPAPGPQPDRDGKLAPPRVIVHDEAEAPLVPQPPLKPQESNPLGA
jgi:hypothetical protein